MSGRYRHHATDRAVRILRALFAAGGGLALCEVVGALGEQGRNSKASTVTMLKEMRDDGRVLYVERQVGDYKRGGLYQLAELGRVWLSDRGFLPGQEQPDAGNEPVDEPILETGAMRGEARTVVLGQALPGQAPAGVVRSVFDLASTVMQP